MHLYQNHEHVHGKYRCTCTLSISLTFVFTDLPSFCTLNRFNLQRAVSLPVSFTLISSGLLEIYLRCKLRPFFYGFISSFKKLNIWRVKFCTFTPSLFLFFLYRFLGSFGLDPLPVHLCSSGHHFYQSQAVCVFLLFSLSFSQHLSLHFASSTLLCCL